MATCPHGMFYDERDEYLRDRDSRADAAILGSSGHLDLARREYEKNPRAFEDDQ